MAERYRLSFAEAEDFVQAVRRKEWAEQKQFDYRWMAALAAAQMSGPALRWHSSLPRDAQGEWGKLELALLDTFAPSQSPATPSRRFTPSSSPATFDLADKSDFHRLALRKTGHLELAANNPKPERIRYSWPPTRGQPSHAQHGIWKMDAGGSVTPIWPLSPQVTVGAVISTPKIQPATPWSQPKPSLSFWSNPEDQFQAEHIRKNSKRVISDFGYRGIVSKKIWRLQVAPQRLESLEPMEDLSTPGSHESSGFALGATLELSQM
ncbi:hypothetical protein M407DRAFT_11364 [Tulasnella calospora MUT 4182]|uniref:Uncharacterized protein n=1 Tax=Tulasnella calospora MUT 4182 TaxID=1051891 RepID=A0A0C3Q6M7_9AGAM|nr:hypothetical protein M407DRAFT_11364 [Tulasnella calospora MUT 4182]